MPLPTMTEVPARNQNGSRRANLISLRLDDDELALVASQAVADHRTVAAYARLGLLTFCEHREREV